jgi:phosphoribosyl-dephospho-CoA transferase
MTEGLQPHDLQRHDLLRIEPLAWARALKARPDLSSHAMIATWAQRQWPVIVRRYLPTDAPDRIPIAISLPPAPNQSGVALQFMPDEVMARVPAVPMCAGLACVPEAWVMTMRELMEVGERYESEARLFGSVLWQQLTGMSYLRQGSDLDLIWPVTDHSHAQALAAAIAAIEARSPVRLDGEFILPGGAAVHWREFQQGAADIIVKTLHRVESRSARNLFA